MSIYELIPYDLESSISNNVYLRGLPRIQKKIFHSSSDESTKEAIKKVNQICNYKPFDKKSLNNQIIKLTYIFTNYLLLTHSLLGRGYSTSMIGRSNYKTLIGVLNDLVKYWSSKNFQEYLCLIIKNINFTIGYTSLKKAKLNIIENFLTQIELYPETFFGSSGVQHRRSWLIENIINFQRNINNMSNEEIQNKLCFIFKNINLVKNPTRFSREDLRLKFIFDFIKDLNNKNLINKKTMNEIIFDTVKNNRPKICKFLREEFNSWL